MNRYPQDYILDWISAGGSLATVGALLIAAWSIRLSLQSKNLSTLTSLSDSLFSERTRAYHDNVFGFEPTHFHVYQMTNLVEQACFLSNHKLVSGKAKKFLDGWLEVEITSMETQEVYASIFRDFNGDELSELQNFRKRMHKKRSIAKLRAYAHWERVISGKRWSSGFF
jgi:hypothetical protein